MSLLDRTRRACHTENCEREPRPGFAYCSECTAIVWRTGRPPVIAKRPAWLERLTARDYTGALR